MVGERKDAVEVVLSDALQTQGETTQRTEHGFLVMGTGFLGVQSGQLQDE